jgi:uncharacterized protein YjbI with pentapeptide repeats
MSAITTWTFSQPNGSTSYNFGIYANDYGDAGGFVIVGYGSTATPFQVFNLGNGNVAIMAMVTDQSGNSYPNYWNSHYALVGGSGNTGMMTWNSGGSDPYEPSNNSDGTGLASEQMFTLWNLGYGNIALQALGGEFQNQFLCGTLGGWYPTEFGLGVGSFIASSGEVAIHVDGDQLPILIISGSGYHLDLAGAELGALNLDYFNMQHCNLAGADLSQTTGWQTTDFTNATLDGANLDGRDLGGATWTNATFNGSDLRQIYSAQNCAMEGAVFDGANLAGVHFDNSSLQGASFIGATLDGANFFGAHLEGAHFDGATLNGTIFNGAYMQGTTFNGCDLSTAAFDPQPDFTRAASGRTTFQNATVPYSLIAQNWSWLDLTGATITGLPKEIDGLVADGALLPDGLVLQNIDLSGASFVGTRMYGINLTGANLAGAILSKALLKGAFLQGANLTNANLDSAWLIAEQTGETTPPASRAAFVTAAEAAKLDGAFMFNTVLDAAHCDAVDFTGVYFLTAPSLGVGQRASAIGAYMNYANFGGEAWLLQAVFDGAQLSGANFDDAHLVGASFRDYDGGATELGPTQFYGAAASISDADIRGTDFTGADMNGCDMEQATCSTGPDSISQTFTGYDNQQVTVAFNFGPTLLGNTTTSTTCPSGKLGPC